MLKERAGVLLTTSIPASRRHICIRCQIALTQSNVHPRSRPNARQHDFAITSSPQVLRHVSSVSSRAYHAGQPLSKDEQTTHNSQPRSRQRRAAAIVTRGNRERETSGHHLDAVNPKSKSDSFQSAAQAADYLRELVRKDQLTDEDLRYALSLLSKREKSFDPSKKRRHHLLQVIDQSAAATAALAKFRPLSSDSDRSNATLLKAAITTQEAPEVEQGTFQNQDEIAINGYGHDAEVPGGQSATDDFEASGRSLLRYLFDDTSAPQSPIPTSVADLPKSPFLDPSMRNARMGALGRKKARASKVAEMSDFERSLHENPYAHMLASGVRMCASTGMRLPTSLLTAFKVQLERQTGKPWMVPSGFSIDRCEEYFINTGDREWSPFSLKDPALINSQTMSIVQAQVEDDTKVQHSATANPTAEDFEEPEIHATEQLLPSDLETLANAKIHSSLDAPSIEMTRGSAYYTQNRLSMTYLAENPRQRRRWFPSRWHMQLKKATDSVVIRTNMAAYVQKLLRCKLVRHLAFVSIRYGTAAVEKLNCKIPDNAFSAVRDPISVSDTADTVVHEMLQQGQAVLYFGGERNAEGADTFREDYMLGERHLEPLDVYEDWELAKTVPIYDMSQILSPLELKWLQSLHIAGTDSGNVYTHPVSVIKSGKMTVKVLELLWQMKNFAPLHAAGHLVVPQMEKSDDA